VADERARGLLRSLRRRAPEDAAAPADVEPPPGARNLVLVVLDSLRYDTWLEAQPAVLSRLGAVERRWSYASWTAPSHYNKLMGLLPHTSPSRVYASDYYKRDFARYSERLGIDGIEFQKFLPSIFLPTFLRSHGYRNHAMVSMPVLNEKTAINRDFDSYTLMPSHNDMAAMLDRLRFDADRPSFYMLNVGETHYPYALPNEDPTEFPRISGVHGVLKNLDVAVAGEDVPEEFFSDETMQLLRDRQVRAVRYIDELFAQLFEIVPKNTWFIVTSDHGELFGESGYFGHGPIMHEKVFEVPFVEGPRP